MNTSDEFKKKELKDKLGWNIVQYSPTDRELNCYRAITSDKTEMWVSNNDLPITLYTAKKHAQRLADRTGKDTIIQKCKCRVYFTGGFTPSVVDHTELHENSCVDILTRRYTPKMRNK